MGLLKPEDWAAQWIAAPAAPAASAEKGESDAG